MATVLKEVDAVVIGVGWTGSILARELTKLFESVFARGQTGGAAQPNILAGADDEIDRLFQ